jgi:hypothetical protein
MVNDEFRKSIDVANKRYYQLKKSRPDANKYPMTRPAYSHVIGENRSKSFNQWKQNLYGISSCLKKITFRRGK